MADIEKLTLFNAIRGYLNKKDQDWLLTKLKIDQTNIRKRLKGLKNQDEFFLILFWLESCKHIIAFDEGISVLTNSYQPDALIYLKNNDKIFVEIKRRDEYKFKISKKNLRKKINFANDFGYPLYFAVNFKNKWGLFPSEFILSKLGRLNIVEDYFNSEFEQVFNSQTFCFPKGIKVIQKYSKDEETIYHNIHYGNLYSYQIIFNNVSIIKAEKDDPNLFFQFILAALHNVMEIKTIVTKNEDTVIERVLKYNLFIMDYHFLLSLLRIIDNKSGFKHDCTTFLKSYLENREKTLDIKVLYKAICDLQNLGIPILKIRKKNKK